MAMFCEMFPKTIQRITGKNSQKDVHKTAKSSQLIVMWRRFIMFCPHQNSLLCIKIWIDVLPLKLFNSVLKLLFFQESHVSIMRTVRNRDEWVSLNIVIKRWIILKSNTFSSGGLDVTCIVILLQYFNVNNRVTKERMEKINFLNKF